jgi:nicotinate-nucleotide adenylyltransferase
MLRLATEDNPKFIIDTFEINKADISYTYQTILYFKNKFPSAQLFLLVGSDQAEKFTLWKNWETILDNANLAVAKRKPEVFDPTKYNFPSEYSKKVIHLSNPIIEISSSSIRNYLKSGRSIRYLVPEKIFNFIISNKLFE